MEKSSGHIQALLHQHRSELREQFGVQGLALFGSQARHDDHGDSDVDLLVEFAPGKKNFDAYMALKFYLERCLGRPVDLVPREALRPALRERVLAEAIDV